jgi:hypothetical protein
VVTTLPTSAPLQTTARVVTLSHPDSAITAMGVNVPAMRRKMVAWSRRRNHGFTRIDHCPRWYSALTPRHALSVAA